VTHRNARGYAGRAFTLQPHHPHERSAVLVLAEPTVPQLTLLKKVPSEHQIFVGNSVEAFERAAPDATIIFNWSGSCALLREVFLKCPNLQWVHSRSASLERTLFPELIESPVLVTNGTGVFSASLGEFALTAILYFAKDLRRMIRNQARGVWEPFDILPISGHTVGIVGYGDIGRAVATRVRPLGMKALAVKRHTTTYSDELVDQFYSPDHRLEMLSRCDYVVVAAPLTEETRGMIGKPEFAAMQSAAVVINIGRGPVINEEALVEALSDRRIKGAALDVFDHEPLPSGHAFYKLENVLLSPHCADHTSDWLDQAMQFFLTQFERWLRHERLLNVVDKKLGY
jgi:phosphoglycerate dehydrogenase-like enzyme